jgi:hypothetical protein
MKPLVIYHANCADGFGAAFAAWLKLGDDAEYVPMQYGHPIGTMPTSMFIGREIYILDFSLPRGDMLWLFEHASRVVWLDHHKTAFEMTDSDGPTFYIEQPSVTAILNNNKSGAYLAWEFFHPGTEVPMFIRHIDDGDRWVFALDGTKAFNKALWSYAPWSFEQWVEWFYDCEQGFNHTYWADFYTEGEAILRAHDQNVQGAVKGAARECVIAALRNPTTLGAPGHPWKQRPGVAHVAEAAGLAANCPPHLTSDVGHELATQSGTFGLCWTLAKEGMTAKCSMRSNGDYDVSAIAKAFGGGGHRNAAGFEVPIETLLGWLK